MRQPHFHLGLCTFIPALLRRCVIALVGLALTLLLDVSTSRAEEAAAPAVGGGVVVQADPWRMASDHQVIVNFTLQLEGVKPYPGMVLTAYRPTRLGRSEGPPYLETGHLRVIALSGSNAIARSMPVGPPAVLHPRGAFVMVGDVLQVRSDVVALAPSGAGIELSRLFPAGDTVLSADSDAVLAELLKSVGSPAEGMVVVYYEGQASTPQGLELANRQAELLARRLAGLLKIDERHLHAVIMPLPGVGLAPRAELRTLSAAPEREPAKKTGVP